MRELSIEEKAKAYDEALKVLHKYDGANIMFTQDLKEEMFPEIAESEDERIRKALIQLVNQCGEELLHPENARQMLAWLEEQGKKEPVDKIEPKFKVGDTIRHKGQGCTCKIDAINTATAEYEVSGCNGTHLPFDFQYAWELVEQESSWSEDDKINLQRAIYYIDTYRCEKADTKEVNECLDWLKHLKDRIQPKNEWSEEDKEMIDDIIRCLPRMANGNIAILPSRAEEYADRLALLSSHWKPSEEQMKALEEVCDLYCDVYNFTPPKALIDLFTDLKNLMN